MYVESGVLNFQNFYHFKTKAGERPPPVSPESEQDYLGSNAAKLSGAQVRTGSELPNLYQCSTLSN